MDYLPFLTYFKKEKENKQAEKVFHTFVIIIAFIFLLSLIVSLTFNHSYMYLTIKGRSMQPTLNPTPIEDNGDYQDGVYIKLTHNVDYNDIIVIDKSAEVDRPFSIIKRALAFSGDKISIVKLPIEKMNENNEIYVDYEYRFLRIKDEQNAKVEILEEDYILSHEYWSEVDSIKLSGVEYEAMFYSKFLMYNSNIDVVNVQYTKQYSNEQMTIPVRFCEIGYSKQKNKQVEQVFYMGDNRTGSQDARNEGPEEITNVMGKVIRIVKNAYTNKDNPFAWFGKVESFFAIIFDEIMDFFAFPA